MMLRNQDDREHILQELIIQLIQSERHREALDELELYLPTFPYQNNPILHIYAGLISLYLAQPSAPNDAFNAALLRDAQFHFEHAQSVDPDNVVAQGFLNRIPALFNTQQTRQANEPDSEEEDINSMVLDDNPKRKRVRT
ncbi:putative RNA polymerase I specific initiation factor [Lyophyllum shimeji]|uniref:RNA polymerase I specific initiation factor n=1 Tax=Lyophyllum shimeji TaxID=47721 RepID=A0A9P3UK16_LYOSH|nr:putative RNA polymerase I specific initiation factor [Lyophyllum shimeji]